MNLLMLGPRYHKSGQVGGIVVSFEMLIDAVSKEKNIALKVIDINKRNYIFKWFAILCIYFKIIVSLPRLTHVSMHGVAIDFFLIAPVIIFLSKIFKFKVSLRKFAGSYRETYKNSNWIKKICIRWVLRNADTCAFQTRYLVSYFSNFGPGIFWLPTARNIALKTRDNRPFEKKFIFLGHVRREKGISELLSAFAIIGNSYSLDIYGSVIDDELLLEAGSLPNVKYQGLLDPEDVTVTLCDYDVLVLPSYKEGYPGVIIEAFSVGLPVIATNLEGISELVFDGENGKLIKPKNVEEIVRAIQFFSESNYLELSKKALNSFKNFDSRSVTQLFLEKIR